MYYDFEELDKMDNIDKAEKQKKQKYFFAHAIFASMLMF